MGSTQVDISEEERDTILAALRLWQAYLEDVISVPPKLEDDLADLATDFDCHKSLDLGDIDELCERLNV